MKYRNMIMKCQ